MKSMQHTMTFSHVIFSSEPPEQHLPVCKEAFFSEEQERNSGLAQGEPQGPQVKDKENRENDMDAEEDSGASQPTSDDQLLFSGNIMMNYAKWGETRGVREALNELKSRKRWNTKPLGKTRSYFQEVKSSIKRSKSKKGQTVKKRKGHKISTIPVSCRVGGESVRDMKSTTASRRYKCRICFRAFKHRAEYFPHLLKCIHCLHGKLYTGI